MVSLEFFGTYLVNNNMNWIHENDMYEIRNQLNMTKDGQKYLRAVVLLFTAESEDENDIED